MTGHHHAHVDDLEVVALQDHGDDVLADVVHVALDGGDHDLAFAAHGFAGGLLLAFFFLDVGDQMGDGLLHHARALDHLGQEHLALAEQVADDVHAVHQRALDHMQGAAAPGQDFAVGLFGVDLDEVGDAVHQGVRQALRHGNRGVGRATPGQLGGFIASRAFGVFGDLDQAFCRIGAAIQHHVFDALAQLRLQVIIDADHAGVHDAHVHAGLDRVVQKHGVDGFAHRVVAPEAERHVADAARDFGAGQVLLDPAGGFDEIDRVVVVFFDAGGDGKDVGIEDDVLGREAHLFDQNLVGTLANLDLALVGVGLPLLVKRHDHRGRTVAADQLGLALEFIDTLFHADRVDDALALDAAQTGFDHRPLGRVDHDRHAGDVGLAGHQIQEAHHGSLAVEHGFVHVDVHHLSAVFHLLTRHGQGLFVLAVQDHAGKGLGTGDVGALADVDEQAIGADLQGLQAGKLHGRNVAHGQASTSARRGSLATALAMAPM